MASRFHIEPVSWATWCGKVQRMTCGRSSPPSAVLAGAAMRTKVKLKGQWRERTRDSSVRKSSTTCPSSCRAKERAESYISVRGPLPVPENSTHVWVGVLPEHPSLHIPLVAYRFFSFRSTAAPKPITRHIVVVSRPAKPSGPNATVSGAALGFENPKREAYPEEVLTHRFRPYGDPGDPPPKDEHMDVDTAKVGPKEKEGSKRKGGETGSSKKKKAKLVAS